MRYDTHKRLARRQRIAYEWWLNSKMPHKERMSMREIGEIYNITRQRVWAIINTPDMRKYMEGLEHGILR